MKTLILLSGGVDSAVVFAMLREDERVALAFDYGQGASIALDMAEDLAAEENVPFAIIEVPEMIEVDGPIVAGRNAVLIAIGAAFAQTRGCERVAIGVNKTDAEVFPDCREEFIRHMDSAIHGAYGVEVHAPLLHMTKREVVKLARTLGVALSHTWSCYGSGPEPCGECLACKVRAEAGA